MYKLLLCWRYLRTRYLAFACIISVMLGVATLIVVNSVMSGFSTKLRDRLHGLLSDVDIEARTMDGFSDPQGKMEIIRRDPFLSDKIEAMTPTLEVFAMLEFHYRGQTMMRPVKVIGIDAEGRARIPGFAEYLIDDKGERLPPTFELSPAAQERYEGRHARLHLTMTPFPEPPAPGEKPPPDPPPVVLDVPHGAIVGYGIAHFRYATEDPKEPFREETALEPGDDIILTTISGVKLAPVEGRFTVCGYSKSEMSEYDANYIFVPLDYLQQIRTMENRVTGIQIKLKDYDRDALQVVAALQKMFPTGSYQVSTWEQKQGPLLGAIAIEKGLLNILLFLIIAVAGFGILAIFSMIVVEKTRDIGVLKALGASNGGVMGIFLGYGLLLGVVGATLGTGMGLTITTKINEIEKLLSTYTGHEIFDRSIYYFKDIPTHTEVMMVLLVNVGALAVAVVFSVLPALRAAMLHPVRALRYE
jgi:lipoprotein-releasing system permease protein